MKSPYNQLATQQGPESLIFNYPGDFRNEQSKKP
jgi:hypothetical protein